MKYNDCWKRELIADDVTLYDVCKSSAYRGASEDNYTWFLSSPNHRSNLVDVVWNLKMAMPYGISMKDIQITSGIRCPKVNAIVGGAQSSYHLHGMAIDIVSTKGPEVLKRIWEKALDSEIVHFYEVIWYKKRGFMHIAAGLLDDVEPKFIIKK